MYEAYWGLEQRPFDTTPDPRFLYRPAVSDTYARLHYGIGVTNGAALLTGTTGCGKTVMARALVQDLGLTSAEVALLNNPSRIAPELLRELLALVEEPDASRQVPTERYQVIHRLSEALYQNFTEGRRMVVVIEEAHLLENREALEEIRLLLNFQLNDAYLVTVLLVGQPALAERVRRFPELDARISARGVLRPLNQRDVGPYIEHRLAVAGRSEPIFSPEAIELVGQYSGGIPRHVNAICDLALALGLGQQAQRIEEELVYQTILNEEHCNV